MCNQRIYVSMQILRLKTRVGAALRQCHVALDYRDHDFSAITQSQESRAAHLFAYRNLTSLLRRIVYVPYTSYIACVVDICSSPTCDACLRCGRNRALRLHGCAITDQSFYRLVQRGK